MPGHRPTTERLAPLRHRWEIVRLIGTAGAPLIVPHVVASILAGLLPVVFVVAAARVIGLTPQAAATGLGGEAWQELQVSFVVMTLAFVGQQAMIPVREIFGDRIARAVDRHEIDLLMDASTGNDSSAAFDEARTAGQLAIAVRELETWVQSPGQACAGQISILTRYTQLVGYLALVAHGLSWWAAFGLGTATLLLRYALRGGLRKYAAARFALGLQESRNEYLRNLSIETFGGKEIRVFGLLGWLQDRWRTANGAWLVESTRARRRFLLWPLFWFTLVALAISMAVFAVIGRNGAAGAEALDVTTFSIVITAALGALALGQVYPESDVATAIGMHAHQSVTEFLESAGHVPTTSALPGAPTEQADRARGVGAPGAGGAGASASVKESITFDRVAFSYPGSEHRVLQDVSFSIPVHGTTAIVGVNGAGKTTLVKLLTRLYEPTSGAIRVDGRDAREITLAHWRRLLSVTFQEFARYEVSILDNVAYGAVEHRDDLDGVMSAIRSVGLPESLGSLGSSLDTPLAQHITGGTELSGGQWQRVALARALFAHAHGAELLILDEPTASLDAHAEARFFTELTRLAPDATVVLVSHRFSTVRQADHIVVLEDGRVAEQGSHDDLLAAEGLYAHLFHTQARRYLPDTSTSGRGR